eukprot:TRINITY_DN2259_c0_g1_i4.p1 TRINITY_DN2259_c0_g1~~TRINITY_DN2259_c0_g1_i4.p1  ORF type:complete len:247 (-),score=62.55 TRINITY_DN2259_c0_g1_i4:73-813(-)
MAAAAAAAAAKQQKPRLSLVERQQKLLEERGFATPSPPQSKAAEAVAVAVGAAPPPPRRSSSEATVGTGRNMMALGFQERQDALLQKTGRGGATKAARRPAPMPFDGDEEAGDGLDDGQSAAGRSVASRASRAPSLHPSLAGSTYSMACSEATIGAGDDTGYWDFQHRVVGAKDLGQRCRECKKPFKTLGEGLTERRGARISMRYHAECFSGFADPRSQTSSSHHMGHLAGTQLEAAPSDKARRCA